ncbi:hypothetical protein [Shewanella halifaxensis]|uniref:hypothetical protein n=1 Tax=Shewanella halifaxensis TaxID=271098 RepID=UPI000D59F9AB|nr:hypothetical protein [Shewanella halifaxensis]
MAIRIFNTYNEASKLAKDISVTHNVTIKFGRKESGFFVDIPDELDQGDEPESIEYELEDYAVEDSYVEDHNYQETLREIREEISDYADSMARSEEDGWFYDNTDGDWENNLVDSNSD